MYPSQYFYRAVDWLYCHGIVSGYPDNTFRPNEPATRAHIAKMIVLGHAWPIQLPPAPTFSDVGTGDWSYPYVETAAGHGIVSGYPDGTYRPNYNTTRGQLAKMIVLAQGWPLIIPLEPTFSDVPPNSTFYPHIETAFAHALIGGYGDGSYRPGVNASRGQLAKILYLALAPP